MSSKTAIQPTRQEDFPQWYQEVVTAADLAENSAVRGCMVIKPWGYGIWEEMQKKLDKRIKDTGHENAYFPLFIPVSFLEKEAAHVEGFAKECAVVTHHRLEAKDGRLVPTGLLEEPLIVRPTSEAIIGTCFSQWVQSHRDLPILINQWANVVRWEMRPRLFLRTAEFLWQEGHTAHASAEEAQEETMKMLRVYEDFAHNELALPVICGQKTARERFPGADKTYCIEAMMQDRKAIQAGTSHNLGQNFAKAFGIRFSGADGELQHAYTTSWGATTRLIGGMVMVHGDDNGMRVPPRVAPKQAVVIPFFTKEKDNAAVLAYAKHVATALGAFRVSVDERDMRGGEKSWMWVKRGVPLRIEVGPRDLEQKTVTLYRRDIDDPKAKETMPFEGFLERFGTILDEIQHNYFQRAKAFLKENTYDHLRSFGDLATFFEGNVQGGFCRVKICGAAQCEDRLDPLKLSVRCLPLDQSGTSGTCIFCNAHATLDAIVAKSY